MNENLILVVDDEPDICVEISGFLSNKGYQTIIAHDGIEALKLFREQGPVLVLTDYKMPLMDGMELLKNIKSLNKDVHVVLLSGAADSRTIVEAMKENAFDFIPKPIDLNNLIMIIKTAIEKTLAARNQGALRRASSNLVREVAEIGDEFTVLYFTQDMDEYSTPKYDLYIRKLVYEHTIKKNLIIFLKNIEYFNNMGLNLLIGIQDFLKEKGYTLFLCSLSPPVDFYLSNLGYISHFNIESTVDSIVERVRLST
ncbi:MAG: response regulator [Chrysiogenales bacterium]|nr:MAG: response regulator [Chrysiogenales bacterium]